MSELKQTISSSASASASPNASANKQFIQVKPDLLINQNHITWIKRIDECMHICIKVDGCTLDTTHKVCKSANPTGYDKIQTLFPSQCV
jgi:hypothetical protein